VLRNSGLGYTIVRPGPLVEEPGGYKALVFDQGNRISQGISCADVADISLKVRAGRSRAQPGLGCVAGVRR
jgi:NAD(P)H-binding